MKVLSMTQPWASLVILGEKRRETRGWSTNYRGTLGIHASKGFPKECRALCSQEPFKSALARHGINDANELPTASILGTVVLEGCIPTSIYKEGHSAFFTPKEPELSFGDYSPNRFAWVLTHVYKLDVPIPAKGSLNLWDYELILPTASPVNVVERQTKLL